MQYKEFGSDKPETILLLHGGGLSWWNYREAAELLGRELHVIVPILDGHAGSDRPFTSIEDNAAGILSFIDERCGGSVLLIGGLSLGGQILLEMLARRPDVCRHALAESAVVIPSRITHALIGPAFGSSYALIRDRRFAALQFRSLHMRQDLFEEYFRDTCAIKKEDLIAFMKANTGYGLNKELQRARAAVRLVAGEKEQSSVLRSARLLHELLPDSRLEIKKGLYHGEFSINHPEEYAAEILEMIGSGGPG